MRNGLLDYNGMRDSGDDDSSKEAVYCSPNKRLFYLYGEVNAKNCADIAYYIQEINLTDDESDEKEKDFKRKPMRIYINSFGGSVYAMWMLIDTISCSKTPVHTICNGYAMSAAFQIFLAGHKRYITPHATLMYHQIYCWRSGKYQDLVDDREHTDLLNKQIEDYVIEKTRLTRETLDTIREKKKDTYFTATDAIENGMADEILKLNEEM